MLFSEQVEALATDRQKEFENAFNGNKPLAPRKGGWTVGDLVFLQGWLIFRCKNMDACSRDEALATDRREEFQGAFISGAPLKPMKGGWVVSDLNSLGLHLEFWLTNMRPCSQDEFRTPLSEVFSEAVA